MTDANYEMLRSRITELRLKKNVSEHKMSLELGKSDSYIRGITSGKALPSLKELYNIIDYFEMSPAEFFAPITDKNSPYTKLCERLRNLDADDLAKVETFINWLEEK